MNLQEFILQLAENALLRPEKYLRSGHNGPYHDPEKPVRNFGHWLITFAKCYEWTGERRFKDKVSELAEYLCSGEARPYGYSFCHRSNPDKDRCNGLIGQAWTFEALAEASAILRDEGYGALAEEVFFQHPFDYRLGLWRCLEIDGKVLDLDATFNHQLWFAACSSLIRSEMENEIKERVTRFLDCLDKNLALLNNGLVLHPIDHLLNAKLEARSGETVWLRRGRNILFRVLGLGGSMGWERRWKEAKAKMRNKLSSKSVGYHPYYM